MLYTKMCERKNIKKEACFTFAFRTSFLYSQHGLLVHASRRSPLICIETVNLKINLLSYLNH